MDSNHRRRKPADLQSAPVGHLGNLPAEPTILRAGDSAKWSSDVNPGNFLKTNFFSRNLWLVRARLGLAGEGIQFFQAQAVGGIGAAGSEFSDFKRDDEVMFGIVLPEEGNEENQRSRWRWTFVK